MAGSPGARDEYYGYVPRIFNLLKTDAGAENIAVYLAQVASEHMGLPSNRDHALDVANTLGAWKEVIKQHE